MLKQTVQDICAFFVICLTVAAMVAAHLMVQADDDLQRSGSTVPNIQHVN